MKSPFDQNAEQEPSSQQSYERNLSRDYAPSERAKVRALDQRAAFNEATLKQRAEAAGANAEIARSRLGLSEELADFKIKIAEEKARLAENSELTKAKRELKVISDANGFLNDAQGMDPSRPSFDTQYQSMMAGYPDAFESKAVQEWANYHVPIAKSRRETATLIEKEAREAKALIATEQRKEKAAGVLKTTLTALEGTDPETGKPYTQKRRSITGSEEEIKQYERTVTPPSGEAFLEQFGIKPKPKKIKYVDGTPEG